MRLVVVAGPDGSGKSAIAQALVDRLAASGTEVRHAHVEMDATGAGRPAVPDPHANSRHGVAGSLAALGRRWARYQRARLLAAVRPEHREVVVQERGWLDQAVDPARYRLDAPIASLVGPLRRTVPRPALVILCEGEPGAIAARKGELTVEETTRQLAVWRRLLTQERLVTVNTTRCALGPTVDEAWAAMADLDCSLPLPKGGRTVVLGPRRVEAVASPQGGAALELLLRPASARGRAARRAAITLFAAGVRGGGTSTPFPLEPLAAAMGVPWDGYALIRSHGRRRWVVGLCANGAVTCVVKVAPAADRSLARESRLLGALRGSAGDLAVPRMLAVAEESGWTALGLEPLRGAPRLHADLEEALGVSVQLARARDGRGVTHGDLAPWNLLVGDRPALVDWERGDERFDPGADLLHYALATAGAERPKAMADHPVHAILARYCDTLGLDRAALLGELGRRWRAGTAYPQGEQ